jgi:hypothetical protein
LILYLHNDIWFVMVQIKIFPVIAIQLTPLQSGCSGRPPPLNSLFTLQGSNKGIVI